MHKTFVEASVVAFDYLTERGVIPSWVAERLKSNKEGAWGILILFLGVVWPASRPWTLQVPLSNQEQLEGQLPKEVVRLIKSRTDIYICGGSVIRSLMGVYKGEDIDIFCLSDEAHRLVHEAMKDAVPSAVPPEFYYSQPSGKYIPMEGSSGTEETEEEKASIPQRQLWVCDMPGVWRSKGAHRYSEILWEVTQKISELRFRSTEDTRGLYIEELYKARECWSKCLLKENVQMTFKVDIINRSQDFCGNPGTSSIMELLEKFDLGLCQVGTNLREVVYTRTFEGFLKEGIVRVSNPQTATCERYKKYLRELNLVGSGEPPSPVSRRYY